MEDSGIAFLIGLMAGSIFFIDGWGPTEKTKENEKKGFAESRRFRGLSVLIVGGIITPVLDYVSKNAKPEFFLAYLKGCIYGWFFVLLFGLLLYLFWIITKQGKETSIWFKTGEFAYSILDFIYLGISDNPHINAKRFSDVDVAKGMYKLHGDHKLKSLEKELANAEFKPDKIEIDQSTRSKLKAYNTEATTSKTESDYSFTDWYYKGIAEYDKKEYEKCIAYMKNALELDKTDINAPDANLYIGISLDLLGLYQKATTQYDKIITEYPQYPRMYIVHYDRGVSLAKQNLLEEAVTAYDIALKINPDYVNAWYNKGINLGRLKRHDQAIAALEEAVKLNPQDYEALNNIGDNLSYLKNYTEALGYVEKAIKIKPDYANAWNNKGVCLFNLGNNEDALLAYNKAIELDPEYGNAWYNKGINLGKLKRYGEAIAAFEEAVKLNPQDFEALYYIGDNLSSLNNYEEALGYFEKVIKIRPDYASAWNSKGICLHKSGNDEDALLAYNKAIELNPDDSNIWSNKAVSLNKLGSPDKAFKALKEAIRLNPQDMDARFNIAAAFALKNDKENMLNHLKAAIDIDMMNKNAAKTDEDFKAFWGDEDFKKLVE